MTEPKACAGPIQRLGRVVENRLVARNTYRMRIEEPIVAGRIRPGQFAMVRAADRTEPLLARPYALFDTIGDEDAPTGLEIIYLVQGAGTQCLSRLAPGTSLDIWGPLGNTFPFEPADVEGKRLALVAGGIGQTPFLAVTKELLGLRRYGGGRAVGRPKSISFFYGARSADHFAGVADFENAGAAVHLATDDGSSGAKGFVTDVLSKALASDGAPELIFACGPEAMLDRVAAIAADTKIPCWVSLETKMACGYGVCFSCVAPIVLDEGWDYRRVCLDGPVFAASKIAWNSPST